MILPQNDGVAHFSRTDGNIRPGQLQLAWLQSAFGVGMVSGGVTLSVWGGFKRRSLTGLLALALGGAGFALVGVAPSNAFPMALAAMFFAWLMNPIANGSLMAVLQIVVPAEMQGRVFTLLQSAAGAMIPLGLLIAGPLAGVLGVQIWFLIAGIAMAVMGLGALFAPAITHLDDIAGQKTTKVASVAEPASIVDAGAVAASAQ
jgi:DHA3 family macrolide efflux protein-like MFS transporter